MGVESNNSHYLVKATPETGVQFTREDHFNAALTSSFSSFGRLRYVTSELGLSFTFQQFLRAAIRDAGRTAYAMMASVSPGRVYRFFLE